MNERDDSACARRLRTALDLAESGIHMRLAQIRRHHPDEDETSIRQRLTEWLLAGSDAGYEGAPWRHLESSSLQTS